VRCELSGNGKGPNSSNIVNEKGARKIVEV